MAGDAWDAGRGVAGVGVPLVCTCVAASILCWIREWDRVRWLYRLMGDVTDLENCRIDYSVEKECLEETVCELRMCNQEHPSLFRMVNHEGLKITVDESFNINISIDIRKSSTETCRTFICASTSVSCAGSIVASL